MSNTTLDEVDIVRRFFEDLTAKTQKLKNCQSEHGYSSCLGCDDFLDCNIRDDYVNSVYLSMNLGNDMDFDF